MSNTFVTVFFFIFVNVS